MPPVDVDERSYTLALDAVDGLVHASAAGAVLSFAFSSRVKVERMILRPVLDAGPSRARCSVIDGAREVGVGRGTVYNQASDHFFDFPAPSQLGTTSFKVAFQGDGGRDGAFHIDSLCLVGSLLK